MSELKGLHSDWITPDVLAMQRPSSRGIKEHNMMQQFVEKGIRAIFNCTMVGEHPYCGYVPWHGPGLSELVSSLCHQCRQSLVIRHSGRSGSQCTTIVLTGCWWTFQSHDFVMNRDGILEKSGFSYDPEEFQVGGRPFHISSCSPETNI